MEKLMQNKNKNDWEENRDHKKAQKSIGRKKKKGMRHHVRDILKELKTSNGDEYYDYIDEIEEK
jgi:hypothetical protein